MLLVAGNHTSTRRSRPHVILALVLGGIAAVLAILAVRPQELWAGGTAVFIGGRYMPPGNPWYAVGSGRFGNLTPVRVRSYLGVERGVYLCVGDFYYVVSWFRGRPAPPLKPGEREVCTLYPH